MSPEQVVVALPTYNEAENLADIVAAIVEQGLDVLVVDDNSPDGTGALADDIAAANPRVSVLHRTTKSGLGPAYAAAFNQLLDQGADIIVEMDADFSHDPGDLPKLVEAVRAGADMAIGSRYVPGGGTPDWPFLRRFISRGGNVYAGVLLGLPVKDATAGFRAFRSEALRELPFSEAEASGYGFQVEMAWRAHSAGLSIVEVPITFRDRTRGTSKMGLGIVLEAMKLVTMWGAQRLLNPWRGRG